MIVSKKKRIAIIGSAGLPPNYGGFETLVDNLTRYNEKDFDITVYCQQTPKSKKIKKYNNCKLKYLPFKANGPQSIIYDISSIILSWFNYNTLLILGSAGTIVLPILRIFKNTNTVFNFGSLEWKRNKWPYIAKKYLKISERIGVKYSSVVITDNQFLTEYVKDNYNIDSILIEYGGDHAKHVNLDNSIIKKYPYIKDKYDLSISRAQPDNQLHFLLEAYCKMPSRKLVLISNYETSKYGIDLKNKYKSFNNIYLQDAIYDQKEINAIRSHAQAYIHTHSLCGTAPSLVEAMFLGLPIIAFDVPANRCSTDNKALYYKDINDLISIMENINEKILIENGKKMKEIAKKRYSWQRISKLYAQYF